VSARRNVAIAALSVPVIVITVLIVIRPGPQDQTEALFERIRGHIESLELGELTAEIDDHYQIVANVPELAEIKDLADSRSAGTDADPNAVFRETIRRQANLQGMQQRQGGGKPTVAFTIHEVGALEEDGTFTALISFSVTGVRRMPTLTEHRFVLSTHGWLLPKALVRSHDPISLN
jgi:hypothetical protein